MGSYQRIQAYFVDIAQFPRDKSGKTPFSAFFFTTDGTMADAAHGNRKKLPKNGEPFASV